MGEGTTPPHRKKKTGSYEILHGASEFANFCEHGNELSGSIQGEEFID